MKDLRKEPEILEYDRGKPQILTANNYVENVSIAIGFASCCWDDKIIFKTDEALRITNELCAYIRLIKEGKLK